MKAGDVQKVLAARAERVKAQQAAGNLVPRSQLVNAQFDAASNSRALLARVSDFLPATFDNAAHVGLVAAQAGITSTLQFASGGFDGHGQLANSYAQSLPRLTDLVDYIITKSGTLGIADRIFVRIYSEFGRTPLNTGNGKDHWSVGTQVLMEATPPAWGNRVFGASGPRHQQLQDRSGHRGGRCGERQGHRTASHPRRAAQVPRHPDLGSEVPVEGAGRPRTSTSSTRTRRPVTRTCNRRFSRRARCAPVSLRAPGLPCARFHLQCSI